MTEAKPRGTKPQDHKQSQKEQHEARLERETVLADLPELVPPHKLRFRDKAKFRAVMLDLFASGLIDEEEHDDGEDISIEFDASDIEKIKVMDDLCATIDEWAESIALDKHAYVEWSGGKGYDEFFAILNRYQDALGESTGS